MNKNILSAGRSPGLVVVSRRFEFDQEFLETLMYEWIRRMIFYSHFNLTKQVIQYMANEFKTELRMDWFSPNSVWLKRFRAKYELNSDDTKVFDIGYKEAKSVQVRDIIRELLLPKHVERQVAKESDKRKPDIQTIEIDDDEDEERSEIIEIEDDQNEPLTTDQPFIINEPLTTDQPFIINEPLTTDQPFITNEPLTTEQPFITNEPLIMDEALFADELKKFDELLTAGKISVVNDIARVDEQLAADSVHFSDELSIDHEPVPIEETSKADNSKAVWNFVDIEDELPRSVCTRFGSTIVQKVQQPRIDPQMDIEELIPTSVCTAQNKPQKEIESTKTPVEDYGLNDDVLLYTDMPKIELSKPIETLSHPVTPTEEKEKCVPQKIKYPTDSSASSMVKIKNTVPKTTKEKCVPQKLKYLTDSGASSTVKIKNTVPKTAKKKAAPRRSLRAIRPNVAPKPEVFYANIAGSEKPQAPAFKNLNESENVTPTIFTGPTVSSSSVLLLVPNASTSAAPTTLISITPEPIAAGFATTAAETVAPIAAAPITAVPIFTVPITAAPITLPSINPAPMTKYHSHRHAQNMIGLTHNIPETNIPSSLSRKKPLRTREEALKCIKLMEEFAMMKENFRLIGYIERLEKLIRTEMKENN